MSDNSQHLDLCSGPTTALIGGSEAAAQNLTVKPCWPAVPEPLRALAIIQKHWQLAVLFAVVASSAVAAVTLLTKPVYEPTARIEIAPPGSEIFSLQGSASGFNEAAFVDTQAQALKADALAIRVVRQLKLASEPDFVSRASLAASSAYTDAISPAENAALASLQERLKVRRDSTSHIVTISFASHSARLAADVVNTLIEQFIEREYEIRHKTITDSTQWLSRELDDLRARMEQSRKEMADFQNQSGLADVDDNRSTYTQTVSRLNDDFLKAQADRIRLEALLRNSGNLPPDAFPQVDNDVEMQQLANKLAMARADLSQARVIYAKEHPNIKKLQREIEELEGQLNARRALILKQLRLSYNVASANERLLADQIKATTSSGAEMARYSALKKQAQVDADLYNSLYARVRESGIAAASKSSNIRIIDQARILDRPTSPNRLRDISLGLIGGILGGLLLAFIAEGFDTRIHSVDDLRSWLDGVAIAAVPAMTATTTVWSGPLLFRKRSMPVPKLDVRPFFLRDPLSPLSESIRGLYSGIRWRQSPAPLQVLMVTSSLLSEGKTTISVNLALAVAQNHHTCIVDADLRKPGVANALGTSSVHSLNEVLSGHVSLDRALTPVDGMPGLEVLSAQDVIDSANRLVCSDAMRCLIRELRRRFDCIIIDTPPVLPYADSRILAGEVDGVIFVGRAGITDRTSLLRSLELLQAANAAPVIKIVMNAANLRSRDYRYYYSRQVS
ncbi:MAG TPA: polysaccharide biosynthesis tyrosine autokinase [Terriglobales bacterium]|nr:polysaccharide biosynthesis tyrosine autokinase [Terriglobales bacterium]